MKKEDIKKVVLAYSGGLDTSIIIPWLKENYNNCEVVAVSGDVGQGTELDGLEEKAKKTGASKLYILDLKKDFVENYIFPTLKFGAKYEDYLLGTSFARPCIAKALADIAIKEGADAICHGCTGKGNDQVRFELTLKALCPDMAIIAPWREWDIKSRDEEIDYAEAHHIPLKINRETNYSKDKNLWHLSHEGLDLENPANEPQYNKPGFLELGVSPEQAPDTPTYITLHFEKGIPTAVDGKEMGAVELVEYLNKVGGENGIGLLDIVENRLVGIVTIDDAISILQDEASEDIAKMNAIGPSDKPYFKQSMWDLYKSRAPWLLFLMISATFSSMVIRGYEDALAAVTVLTAYIPMLTDAGGNAGSQSTSTIIRGMAVGDIALSDFPKVLRVALLCGGTLAVCNFVKLLVFDRIAAPVALVVCLTLICTILLSQIIGGILPVAAEKLHVDPAVMASPLITTIVDTTTLLIYFNIAKMLLHL